MAASWSPDANLSVPTLRLAFLLHRLFQILVFLEPLILPFLPAANPYYPNPPLLQLTLCNFTVEQVREGDITYGLLVECEKNLFGKHKKGFRYRD